MHALLTVQKFSAAVVLFTVIRRLLYDFFAADSLFSFVDSCR